MRWPHISDNLLIAQEVNEQKIHQRDNNVMPSLTPQDTNVDKSKIVDNLGLKIHCNERFQSSAFTPSIMSHRNWNTTLTYGVEAKPNGI